MRRTVRKIIEINESLCNGCGKCATACAEGAIQMIDGKAKLVSDVYCDGLGACIGECPTGALQIVEREAQAFDEEAAKNRVAGLQPAQQPPAVPCGCPSMQARSFAASPGTTGLNDPSAVSSLTHWPVQIHLVPPSAPFLEGADLLVTADCVPVAYAGYHHLLEGRVALVGCPKFDDRDAYAQKFAAIFHTAGVRSVTVIVMEVPCCQGLPAVVQAGMASAGKRIPLEVITVSLRGEILQRNRWVA